jgi:hypothetical protein
MYTKIHVVQPAFQLDMFCFLFDDSFELTSCLFEIYYSLKKVGSGVDAFTIRNPPHFMDIVGTSIGPNRVFPMTKP